MAVPIVYQNFIPPAIDAGNLNTVNNVVYTVIGDGVNAPLNAANVRTNIGLGTLATQNANAIAVTGGTVAGITSTNSTIVAGTVTSLLTPLSLANGGTGTTIAPPVMSANLTANQALTSGVQAVILYNSVDFDTNAFYTAGTGRFTPTIAGYYSFSFAMLFDGNGSTITNAVGSLFKNGVEYLRGGQVVVAAAANLGFSGSTGSVVVQMNGTTDFVDIRALCSTTAGNPRLVGPTGSRFSANFIRS